MFESVRVKREGYMLRAMLACNTGLVGVDQHLFPYCWTAVERESVRRSSSDVNTGTWIIWCQRSLIDWLWNLKKGVLILSPCVDGLYTRKTLSEDVNQAFKHRGSSSKIHVGCATLSVLVSQRTISTMEFEFLLQLCLFFGVSIRVTMCGYFDWMILGTYRLQNPNSLQNNKL